MFLRIYDTKAFFAVSIRTMAKKAYRFLCTVEKQGRKKPPGR